MHAVKKIFLVSALIKSLFQFIYAIYKTGRNSELVIL